MSWGPQLLRLGRRSRPLERGQPHRYRAAAVGEPSLKRTPLYEEHRKLGARIVPFAGWEMPVQYAGVVKEHHAVRTAAGLFDVSHMGELIFTGPEALAAVDGAVTNDVGALAVGQARYTVCCNDRGTILDDLIVYRQGPERVLVVCNASNRDKISSHMAQSVAGRCAFEDISDATALIALQGPRAFDVLAGAGAGAEPSLAELGPFHLTQARVADAETTVARTGYTGEDGVEIFCRNDDAPRVWRALMEAGQPHGIMPAGLGARDTLRLEARLCLYGNDIDETTNPFEAGLAWTVKLHKGHFTGKEVLERVEAAGVSRNLVGFEMTGRGIARHGYPIVDIAGQEVGIVTSGSPSPTLGKNIGLGYVPAALSRRGAPLGVQIRGKVVEAVIVKTPFYKRKV